MEQTELDKFEKHLDKKIEELEPEHKTPFPLPDLSENPKPPKVDKRKTRKLSPEQLEKMRLGRIKARARREEKLTAKQVMERPTLQVLAPDQKVESPSPSPLLLRLLKSTSEELPLEETSPRLSPTPALSKAQQEFVGKTWPSEDNELESFKEFLNTEFGPAGVEQQLRGLFSGGFAPIPPPPRWAISPNLDLCHLVWEQVQSDAYIDSIWPCLKLLLQRDTLNRSWAAGVATVLSLFNIIRILPVVTSGLNEAKSQSQAERE